MYEQWILWLLKSILLQEIPEMWRNSGWNIKKLLSPLSLQEFIIWRYAQQLNKWSFPSLTDSLTQLYATHLHTGL